MNPNFMATTSPMSSEGKGTRITVLDPIILVFFPFSGVECRLSDCEQSYRSVSVNTLVERAIGSGVHIDTEHTVIGPSSRCFSMSNGNS